MILDALCIYIIRHKADENFLNFNELSNSLPYESIKKPTSVQSSIHPEQLGVFPLPPRWDASPSKGYPQALNSLVPIYAPGWREVLWELGSRQ